MSPNSHPQSWLSSLVELLEEIVHTIIAGIRFTLQHPRQALAHVVCLVMGTAVAVTTVLVIAFGSDKLLHPAYDWINPATLDGLPLVVKVGIGLMLFALVVLVYGPAIWAAATVTPRAYHWLRLRAGVPDVPAARQLGLYIPARLRGELG